MLQDRDTTHATDPHWKQRADHRKNGCNTKEPSALAQLQGLLHGGFWLSWHQVQMHFEGSKYAVPTYEQYERCILLMRPPKRYYQGD